MCSLRILFYSDSIVFGGHESMFVDHLKRDSTCKQVFKNHHIAFAFSNHKLQNSIASIFKDEKGITIYGIPPAYTLLDQFLCFFSISRLYTVFKLFLNYNPDVIVCLPGRIESCNLGLWAAKILRIKVVAYLPMTHKRKDIFGKLLDGVRDYYNSILYEQYDGIITITENQLKNLDAPIRAKCHILHNFTDYLDSSAYNKERSEYLRVGYLGRLQQKQKNVLVLVPFFNTLIKDVKNAKLIIKGDGPELPAIKSQISKYKLDSYVTLLSWSDDIESFFSNIDILILPSYFEGVSLVMLQSLIRHVPVIGTNNGDFRDVLPDFALFNLNDLNSFVTALKNSIEERENWVEVYKTIRLKMLSVENSESILKVISANFFNSKSNVYV